jgi:hypothetical protein
MDPRFAGFPDSNPDEEELNRVYNEWLSYRKAWSELGGRPNEDRPDSWEWYARVILYLETESLLDEFHDVVAKLRSTYDAEMKRIGLRSSAFGNDDSWIHWDVAKQIYLSLNPERAAAWPRYRVANPLVDRPIRDEIVSRHVGWEFWFPGKPALGDANATLPEPWSRDSEISCLLKFGSSKHSNQPASWALAEIGKRLRRS